MKFSCDQCSTRYTIADSKVEGKILKIRCKVCGNIMSVRGARRGSTVPPAGIRVNRPSVPPIPDYEWYAAPGHKQIGPMPIERLLSMIRSGEIGRQTIVWNESLPNWTPAAEIEKLKPLFPPPIPAMSLELGKRDESPTAPARLADKDTLLAPVIDPDGHTTSPEPYLAANDTRQQTIGAPAVSESAAPGFDPEALIDTTERPKVSSLLTVKSPETGLPESATPAESNFAEHAPSIDDSKDDVGQQPTDSQASDEGAQRLIEQGTMVEKLDRFEKTEALDTRQVARLMDAQQDEPAEPSLGESLEASGVEKSEAVEPNIDEPFEDPAGFASAEPMDSVSQRDLNTSFDEPLSDEDSGGESGTSLGDDLQSGTDDNLDAAPEDELAPVSESLDSADGALEGDDIPKNDEIESFDARDALSDGRESVESSGYQRDIESDGGQAVAADLSALQHDSDQSAVSAEDDLEDISSEVRAAAPIHVEPVVDSIGADAVEELPEGDSESDTLGSQEAWKNEGDGPAAGIATDDGLVVDQGVVSSEEQDGSHVDDLAGSGAELELRDGSDEDVGIQLPEEGQEDLLGRGHEVPTEKPAGIPVSLMTQDISQLQISEMELPEDDLLPAAPRDTDGLLDTRELDKSDWLKAPPEPAIGAAQPTAPIAPRPADVPTTQKPEPKGSMLPIMVAAGLVMVLGAGVAILGTQGESTPVLAVVEEGPSKESPSAAQQPQVDSEVQAPAQPSEDAIADEDQQREPEPTQEIEGRRVAANSIQTPGKRRRQASSKAPKTEKKSRPPKERLAVAPAAQRKRVQEGKKEESVSSKPEKRRDQESRRQRRNRLPDDARSASRGKRNGARSSSKSQPQPAIQIDNDIFGNNDLDGVFGDGPSARKKTKRRSLGSSSEGRMASIETKSTPKPQYKRSATSGPRAPVANVPNPLAKQNVEEEDLSDGLSQKEVVEVIGQYKKGLDGCYMRQLKKGPINDGRLTLKFRIRSSGKTSRVTIGRKYDGTVLKSCLDRLVRRWRFPQFKGEPIDIEYPLIFTTRF